MQRLYRPFPGLWARYKSTSLLLIIALGSLASGFVISRPAVKPKLRHIRIGVDQAAPYQVWTPEGPIGFTVDVLRLAAAEEGMELEWVFRPEGPYTALKEGAVDVWPLVAVEGAQAVGLYAARPWLENQYSIAWRNDGTQQHRPQPDWRRRRISLANMLLAKAWAVKTFPESIQDLTSTRTEALQHLCAGQSEAAFMEIRLIEALLLHRPPGCEAVDLRLEVIPNITLPMSLASQFKLRREVDALRHGIEILFENGAFNRLVDRWFVFSGVEARSLVEVQREKRLKVYLVSMLFVVLSVLFWALVLYRRARHASDAAQRANLAKSQFLANVSHDVRTPMNGVLTMADILLLTPLAEEQREYATCIRDSANLQLAILNDLLDSAKIESGKLVLETVEFSPHDVLEQLRTSFSAAARDHNVELVLDAEGLPATVVGDSLRFRQVMSNLLGNAIKFTHDGRVTIEASCAADGRLSFGVRDTGIGIEPSHQARIFEKFSQADESMTRRFGGTGLGLSICKDLVKLMGGDIQVESALGEGSRFWFTLSLAVGRQAAEPCPGSPPEVILRSDLPLLVVEDNRVNQKVVLALLRRMGLHAEVANNGAEAIEKFTTQEFSVILMDCQMPVMDGLEATRRIRRLRRPQVPIIACSAGASLGERELAREAGMNAFISKPIQREEFAVVLRDMLTKSTLQPN